MLLFFWLSCGTLVHHDVNLYKENKNIQCCCKKVCCCETPVLKTIKKISQIKERVFNCLYAIIKLIRLLNINLVMFLSSCLWLRLGKHTTVITLVLCNSKSRLASVFVLVFMIRLESKYTSAYVEDADVK